MAIKVYRKNTAARRNMSVVKSDMLTDARPQKNLLTKLTKKSGRSHGKISVRHKGGGHKRRYRVIDFKQDKRGVEGKILSIEKDPNRSALIALIGYVDGDKRYILASEGMQQGNSVITDESAPIQEGNRVMLKNIPAGYAVSNIELIPGKGGQIMRSAGSGALLMGIDKKYAQIKMASGEVRLVPNTCYATIGKVSNFEHSSARVGKAGKSRWLNKRPAVRGSAMNPVDHPHGGGEGRQGVGLKYPKTPWGKPALGVKTRRKHRKSNKLIIKRRGKK